GGPPRGAGAGGPGGGRGTGGAGRAALKCRGGAPAIGLECFAPAVAGAAMLPVRLLVQHRWFWPLSPSMVYADEIVRVERGAWRTVVLPLPRRPEAGEEIEVKITPDPAAVDAGPASALPGDEPGLAVHRVWFEPSQPTAASP